MQIVVTCHANGTVETLLKDKVLDTRKFGDRRVERVSQVLFSEKFQRFYIEWLKGPKAPVKGTSIETVDDVVFEVPRHWGDQKILEKYYDNVKWFDTYEDAVAHEIAEVNKLRLEGYSFA